MKPEENHYELPAVALRGMAILPDMIIHFDLSRKKSIQAVEEAMAADQMILVAAQRDPNTEDPGYEDMYAVGTIAVIRQMTKLPGEIVRVLVEGKMRAKLLSFSEEMTE